MEQLELTLNNVLANAFIMYFKAQSYHWNVECKNFAEMHGFFGGLYEDVYTSTDVIAEEMRACGYYAPSSLMELYNYKTITEDAEKPASVDQMLVRIGAANDSMIESLNKLFKDATAADEQGLADFAAGRLDVHKKHGWMIKSFLKGGE